MEGDRQTTVCACPCLAVIFQKIAFDGWVGQQSQIVTLAVDFIVKVVFLEVKADRN